MKKFNLLHDFICMLQSTFSNVTKILLYIILLSFYNCENKISAPERVINQPGILEAYGYNNSITVKFYGNNIEEGFKGYNVYISKIAGMISQGMEPVENFYGFKPTLLYASTGCFADASQKSYVTLTKDSSGNLLVNNTDYYIAVSAYLLIGDNEYESDVTEEVQVKINIKTNVILSNQQIMGNTNEGIIFTNNNGFKYIGVPDVPIAGSAGDMFFKLQNINSTILPVLSTEYNRHGNNSIQDVGYVADMAEFNNIPELGYIQNDYLVAIENHLYILKIPKENRHIKIYVDQIGGSYIKLWIMYTY